MPQERNKNKRKIAAKTISNAVHKLYFFLVFLVFFANAGHGRKFNDIEMPKSKTKADTDPKIAQNGPTWAQYGSPKWPKISLIWSQLLPNKGRPKPQNTPKMVQQRQTQTTEYTKMAQHEPIIWCRHSPQWPNISPRSGKHSLTAACPKKETKTNEK